MTLLDVAFHYGNPPGETELRALNEIREVYGIWRIRFDEPNKIVTVEYDASRLTDDEIAFLMRNAGLDLKAKVELLTHPPIYKAA